MCDHERFACPGEGKRIRSVKAVHAFLLLMASGNVLAEVLQ